MPASSSNNLESIFIVYKTSNEIGINNQSQYFIGLHNFIDKPLILYDVVKSITVIKYLNNFILI
jgi:hypothetical protein